MKERFSYITRNDGKGGGVPDLEFTVLNKSLNHSRISIEKQAVLSEYSGDEIIPIPVKHGSLDIYGYRLGNFAYITDCSFIPDDSMKLLEGIEVLTLGALRYRPHTTHFTIDQAVEIINRSGAKKGYLTHFLP